MYSGFNQFTDTLVSRQGPHGPDSQSPSRLFPTLWSLPLPSRYSTHKEAWGRFRQVAATHLSPKHVMKTHPPARQKSKWTVCHLPRDPKRRNEASLAECRNPAGPLLATASFARTCLIPHYGCLPCFPSTPLPPLCLGRLTAMDPISAPLASWSPVDAERWEALQEKKGVRDSFPGFLPARLLGLVRPPLPKPLLPSTRISPSGFPPGWNCFPLLRHTFTGGSCMKLTLSYPIMWPTCVHC